MVQTPVGARCPDCARLYKLPTYQVSQKYYLRAIGVGVGMALGCGFLWGLVGYLMRFMPYHLYLNLLLAPAVGYAIGEVTSLAVNRKRGRSLAAIAAVMTAVAYLVGLVSPWGFGFHLLDLISLALGIFVAVTRLR